MSGSVSSNGVHGDVRQLLAQQQRLHLRPGDEALGRRLQFDAGRVAAAGDGTDHHAIVLLHDPHANESARLQVSVSIGLFTFLELQF